MSATIAAALALARCLKGQSDSWRLDGELMLAEVTGRARAWLLAHDDVELNPAAMTRYQDLLQRRLNGEPLAYIVGRKAFLDFEVAVTPTVLIPRPETELLVELTLELTRARAAEPLRVADLGTGSGIIAIALARRNPHWRIQAVDISGEALQLARRNAARLGAGNIEFIHASWYDGLDQSGYDALVANPPYVAAGDPHLQGDGLAFEPSQALQAGEDGMAVLKTIITQAGGYLKEDSWLLLEHGYDQQAGVIALLETQGFVDIRAERDYAGNDRVVAGRRGA